MPATCRCDDVSVAALTALREYDGALTATEHHVLIVLCDHANSEELTWPSVATIADETRLGVRTIRHALHSLMDRRLIDVQRRRGPGGHQGSNCYRVMIPRLQQMHPGEPVQSATDTRQSATNDHPRLQLLHPYVEASVEASDRSPSAPSALPTTQGDSLSIHHLTSNGIAGQLWDALDPKPLIGYRDFSKLVGVAVTSGYSPE